MVLSESRLPPQWCLLIPLCPAVDQVAGSVGGLHGAVIAQGHLDKKLLGEVPGLVHAEIDQGRGAHVEHHQIGLHARRDAAHTVIEIEGAGAAQYAGILKELEALSDEEVRALLAAEQNGTSSGKPQT